MIIASKTLPAQNKTISNIAFLASLVVSLLFTFCSTAQIKAYLPLLNRADSCSLYKIEAGTKLYHIVFKENAGYKDYEFCGWLQLETPGYYQFVQITGSKRRFKKEIVDSVVQCRGDEEILGHIEKSNNNFLSYCGQTVLPYALVALWAYKNNNERFALQLNAKAKEKKLDISSLKDYMGYMYYNKMLVAYSLGRNYAEAAIYGDHLASKVFEGFEYRSEAAALANQLRIRTADFNALTLPDSANWERLKLVVSRKEQIDFLLDRLHLLNCMQMSQPGGIYFTDVQSVYSFDTLSSLNGYLHENIKKFAVINPYSEILQLKPTVAEVELFASRLLDTTFIPSYSYHRDFKCQRRLFKYFWVIDDLIFHISNRHFIDVNEFDSLDPAEKKERIDSIVIWCRVNSALTDRERLHKVLYESKNWREFSKALKLSVSSRDSSITDILPQKFGTFDMFDWAWPSKDGEIAKAMYELSTGKDPDKWAVMAWQNATDDEWVRLFASLFLMKFDTANDHVHVASLAAILEKCDGTSFYPYAIQPLLLRNDSVSMQMAEEVLHKERFISMFYWSEEMEILKLLLLYKSVKAFDFLNKGLNDGSLEDRYAYAADGRKFEILACDDYVQVVADWREHRKDFNAKIDYNSEWPVAQRREYAHELSGWLTQQYELIKAGKESMIKLDPNAPKTVTTIDR